MWEKLRARADSVLIGRNLYLPMEHLYVERQCSLLRIHIHRVSTAREFHDVVGMWREVCCFDVGEPHEVAGFASRTIENFKTCRTVVHTE